MKYETLTSELKLELEKIAIKHKLKIFILFGSRAKGTSKKTSDWDFAFLIHKDISANKYIKLHEDLMNLFNYERIDLIDLSRSTDLYFISKVFETGILIYEIQKGLFIKKKMDAWFEFQDFAPNYVLREKIIKKRLCMLMEN